jgi:hypothetical protein
LTDIVADIKPTTIIWISWYKKSAKISTEITEDVIREIALKSIFADVKVCAVTDVWSGLNWLSGKKKGIFKTELSALQSIALHHPYGLNAREYHASKVPFY